MFLLTYRLFLSTLSLRRATAINGRNPDFEGISIHALLAESDFVGYVRGVFLLRISIHALLAESDHRLYSLVTTIPSFLSTLSLRRATQEIPSECCSGTSISIHALLAESDFRLALYPLHRQQHFYPRSPCGERPSDFSNGANQLIISIHALLAESDARLRILSIFTTSISIHALLAESDQPHFPCTELYQHFYPRSPCGERLGSRFMFNLLFKFLSTLSLRRATLD